MKNLGVFLFSGLLIFISGVFTTEEKKEEPFVPDPFLVNETTLLVNKKEILEKGIETKLEYQSYLLDTINQKSR